MRIYATLVLFLSLLCSNLNAAERPNILWIYLEDVSGWFGCYGDTVIETPNIDALAESGIRFDRFYTPAGVCSTTRSAIITGMWQTTIGAHNHRSCRPTFRGKDMGKFDENILPKNVVPLPIRFRNAGYYTFNEGGKDDYNFSYEIAEFYDHVPKKRGWGPSALVTGECWKGKKDGQPFFGQVQLGGGKLGGRAKKVVDRSKVPVPPYYPDVAEVREEIAHHYDCLLKTDEQVGEVIAALKRDGYYDNTLIFMFSDHGYKLHRHKQFLYEGGIHMPCVVAGNGIEGGKVRDDLVSGIDVSAASLAAAGIEIPQSMEGRDFLADGYQQRDYVISARDRCDYTIEKIRAVVTPRFKYLRNYLTDRPYMQPSYKDGWAVSKKFRAMMVAGEMNETQLIFFSEDRVPEEFYDLANDPHEIHNLADDPKFAAELEKHRQILADWIEETGDKGQPPESDIGLLCTLKRWGDKCVNPEYDKVRHLLKSDPKVKPKKARNNYGAVAKPMTGKRLMNISGTDDHLVPYRGGPSKHIPAKGGKLDFVDAEESILLWARQMGYKGEKLSEPSKIDGKLAVFSYFNGDVMHYKVLDESHGASGAISEKILLDFREGDKTRNGKP